MFKTWLHSHVSLSSNSSGVTHLYFWLSAVQRIYHKLLKWKRWLMGTMLHGAVRICFPGLSTIKLSLWARGIHRHCITRQRLLLSQSPPVVTCQILPAIINNGKSESQWRSSVHFYSPWFVSCGMVVVKNIRLAKWTMIKRWNQRIWWRRYRKGYNIYDRFYDGILDIHHQMCFKKFWDFETRL